MPLSASTNAKLREALEKIVLAGTTAYEHTPEYQKIFNIKSMKSYSGEAIIAREALAVCDEIAVGKS